MIPEPSPDDTPFLEPFTISVPAGSKGTVTFVPEESGSTFYLASVAISKEEQTTYEIRDDSTPMYGPAAVPPTDIDDSGVTWVPCQSFESSLKVIIKNVSSTQRTYTVLPMGYETVEGA
ncbi:hypothetical protein [Halolamina litorea]|uniref:Uncharacterized protein n=1 Tax=Halolamina litorea TaxID=1515593 RepID=A0ABD6BLL9_9EURY|nr:hypothetical protein [Halolamina litorea]